MHTVLFDWYEKWPFVQSGQVNYNKYLKPINLNDWNTADDINDDETDTDSVEFDIIRSEKPSQVIKKMILDGMFQGQEVIEESEDENAIQEEVLENSLLSDRSLSNDSGLAGDFPSIENTSCDEDPEECKTIENSEQSDGEDFVPSKSDLEDDETSEEESDCEKPPKKRKIVKENNFNVPGNPLDPRSESEGIEVNQNENTERSESPILFDSPEKKSMPKKKIVLKKKTEEKEDAFEVPDDHESDEPIVTIPRSSKTSEGSRVYDKRHFCLYCGKGDLKIARHLLSHHAEEEAIKNLEAADAKERKKQLDYLRFKGDYARNMIVLKKGGELILWRRPQPNDIVRVADYVPCQFCFAFVTESELWRHHKSCQFVPNGAKGCVQDSKLLLYTHQVKEDEFPELQALVIDKMNNDEIKQLVSKDGIIKLYGAFHLENGGLKKVHTISDRMRVMARLLQEVRIDAKQPELSLRDIICPEYFDAIVKSTKALGGFSMSKEGEPIPSFITPSIPLKVGYTISKCAELLRGKAIKTRDSAIEDASERFLKLYNIEWSKRINTVSLKTISTAKFEKVQYLPVTEDLLKIRDYLQVGIRTYTEKLTNDVNLKNWRKLAEIVSTRLTIFNRRRSSEVFNLLLSRYKEKQKWKDSQMTDIKDSLSALEQNLMNRLHLVHVQGKRGRQVSILFNDDEKKAMDAIIKYRDEVGVPTENLYVFAAPKNVKMPLRGNDTIRKVISEVPNLQHPERVKSTALRKYCATVSQIIDLDDNGMRWLADHLGHNLDVHREYYRLRESTVELSKVSRLLLSIDEGNIKKFAGKKLSEITLEELPALAEEEEVNNDNMVVDENEENVEVKAPRKRWTQNEKKIVMDAFPEHIKNHKLPKKAECLRVIADNEILKERNWKNIKDFVRNLNMKKKE